MHEKERKYIMNEQAFDMVWNEKAKDNREDIAFLDIEQSKKAIQFHKSFAVYQKTPLICLENMAKKLNVNHIYVKDESYRFGLNAFKVLGASYAIANKIAEKMGQDITQLSAESILSKEVKQKTGDMTFVAATDGNHGRSVAWTAKKLGQKSVIYMPKGSSQERLQNIIAEGAEAEITDKNYDDAVRLAYEQSKQKGWIMVQDTAWEGYEDIPKWIMQGYTTMAYEIMEQLEGKQAPTHIFLQAGVGSMAGAVTGFFSNIYKEKKPIIVIVEPAKADCLFRTAKADDGKLHNVTGDMDTIMAGLACGEPCSIGWNVLKGYADAFIRCPEYMAADGMRMLAANLKGDTSIISGESGAAGFGCMANILQCQELESVKNKLQLNEHSNILCISTEGDTDAENYKNIVWGGKYTKFE